MSDVVEFRPEDEELPAYFRKQKRYRQGRRLEPPPLGHLLRTEIRKVFGLLVTLGQRGVKATHDEVTLLNVIRACHEAMEDWEEKNVEFKRIARERARNFNEKERSEDY